MILIHVSLRCPEENACFVKTIVVNCMVIAFKHSINVWQYRINEKPRTHFAPINLARALSVYVYCLARTLKQSLNYHTKRKNEYYNKNDH